MNFFPSLVTSVSSSDNNREQKVPFFLIHLKEEGNLTNFLPDSNLDDDHRREVKKTKMKALHSHHQEAIAKLIKNRKKEKKKKETENDQDSN